MQFSPAGAANYRVMEESLDRVRVVVKPEYRLDLTEGNELYANYLDGGEAKGSFCLWDLDGDGEKEPLTLNNCILSVYCSAEIGKVVLLDSYDFTSDTLCLLEVGDPAYPGMISSVNGGGQIWYKYITLENGKLQLTAIVEEDLSGTTGEVGTLQKHTDDETLITAALTAGQDGRLVPFLPVSARS